MRSPFLHATVRQGLAPYLRPGGEVLTKRMLELLQPGSSTRILDAGCGTGATLKLLQQSGLRNLVGIDSQHHHIREVLHNGNLALQADCAELPFPGNHFDMLICECVWNITRKHHSLAEFFRVLCPGGTLVLSDIYFRGTALGQTNSPWPSRSCFSQAENLQTTTDMITAAGFTLLHVEDQSYLLKQAAAEFVFAHGSLQAFWQHVLGDQQRADAVCEATRTKRPGLFLLLARRNHP